MKTRRTNANAMGAVAMIMCAVLSGCSTHRKTARQTDMELARHSISIDSAHTMTTEDMRAMVSRNENLHIVIYDTSQPADNSTGKPPVAAEIWNDTDVKVDIAGAREQNETRVKDEATKEMQSISTEEETETATDNRPATALWWWIAAAIVSLLCGMVELRIKK